MTTLEAPAPDRPALPAILADLDAGTRRAAVPDPAAPGGWRVDGEVKAAILACFRDRATESWDLGGALRFRDRVGLPPKALLDGREADAALAAGRPWRIVPGGTSVRAGAYLGPGVVVMPPSFVNVGAWIGEDTMVDSHVLVGSCAQVGARVHLSAGVTLGGVLEPAGARPVIVEDDAFVGAGSSLLEGVLIGTGAVIGAGVVLTGTSRLYDLVRGVVRTGTADAPLAVPPGAVVVPGTPRHRWGSRPGARPVGGRRAAREGSGRRDRRPARAGGGASMTLAAREPALVAAGRVAGIDALDLATRFGTPLFVYDLDAVSTRVETLRAALPPSFDLAFAVKANPLLAVLQHLRALGVGADVASGGELRHVLRAGFDPRRIVLTGPGKRDEELAAAVDAGIGVVTIESRGELRRLARIAEAAGRVQPVLLRLSAAADADAERVRIIGDAGAGKFGMDEADLRAAATEAVESAWLEPWGVHAFGASNLLDAAVLTAHVAATVELAAEVAADAGFPLRLVDAGGGLGIPYRDDEPSLDLAALGTGLAAIGHRLAQGATTAAARVLLEPGRWLVGPAGAYVTRVVDRKRVGESEVAILDGGIHHVLRPVLVGQPHRVVAVTGEAARVPMDAVTLAGPLCTGLDVLARDLPLGGLAAGDLVAVLDLGAYGATESMPLFLSHAMPAEVVVRGGTAHLARPRLEPETWLDRHLDLPDPEVPAGA